MRIEQFFKFTNIVRITQNISYCFVSECIIYSIPNDRSLCRIYLSTKKFNSDEIPPRAEVYWRNFFYQDARKGIIAIDEKITSWCYIYRANTRNENKFMAKYYSKIVYWEDEFFFFFQFNHSLIGVKQFKKKTKNQIAQNSTSPSKSIKSANPQ